MATPIASGSHGAASTMRRSTAAQRLFARSGSVDCVAAARRIWASIRGSQNSAQLMLYGLCGMNAAQLRRCERKSAAAG